MQGAFPHHVNVTTTVRKKVSEDILSGVVMSVQYSKYYEELREEQAKRRYEEKVKSCGCLKDLYCYLESKRSVTNAIELTEWPDVTYAEVYDYLVLTVSFYTRDQLKAKKSLDDYNFFVNGWVNGVTVLKVDNSSINYLFLSTVKHSQSVSLPPLRVWVITKSDGEVITAHCTCMAGLGEVCSHVAAVLFAAEANSLTKLQFSSTSLPCSWLPPTFRSVNFSEINGIDFSTPQHKRKLSTIGESAPKSKKYTILPPTEETIEEPLC